MLHDVFVAGIYGLGLMGLTGIAYGIIHRRIKNPTMQSITVGIVFSITAILSMQYSIDLRDGILIDSRSVIVGLASAAGGVPAAIISSILVGYYRLQMGGMGGVAGAAGILICAILGLTWAHVISGKSFGKPMQLLGLGGLLSLHSLTIFLFLPWQIAADLSFMFIPFLSAHSIVGALVMGSLIDREQRYIRVEKHWRQTAGTDSLTMLPNRRAFADKLTSLKRDDRPKQNYTLFILDIDLFKTIKDTYGHDGGDQALKGLSGVLSRIALPGEHIYQLGGEEFAVLSEGAGGAACVERAEVYRTAVAGNPVRYGNGHIAITVSIGIANLTGQSIINTDALLLEADKALYHAKADGRNCVRAFAQPEGMLETTQQPLLRLDGSRGSGLTGRMRSVEAEVRRLG